VSLVDTHAHLDALGRDGSLPGVLARARSAGLEGIIAIGTEPLDWLIHLGIARDHPGFVHATVGLHPCTVDAGWETAVGRIGAFWESGSHPLPVALGECGLDRFHLPKDAAEAERIFSWQRAAFAAQLELARRIGCPLVVHSRGAFRESVEMITASGVDWSRVVFHCFSEGPAEIAELGRLGGRGSFTGILTYKNAGNVRDAAIKQGLARLMIETDAPYLAPVPHRGKPNEPAYVGAIAEYAAPLFGVSVEELAAVTTANARAFFGLRGP
jgi:TatD DNase family protein